MAAAALAGLTAACEPQPLPSNGREPQAPSTPVAVDFCRRAETALTAVRAANSLQDLAAPVEDFLRTASESDDPSLVYLASNVADAYRGSAPELSLGPALTNVVEVCRQ